MAKVEGKHRLHLLVLDEDYALLRTLADTHYRGSLTAALMTSVQLATYMRSQHEVYVRDELGKESRVVIL